MPTRVASPPDARWSCRSDGGVPGRVGERRRPLRRRHRARASDPARRRSPAPRPLRAAQRRIAVPPLLLARARTHRRASRTADDRRLRPAHGARRPARRRHRRGRALRPHRRRRGRGRVLGAGRPAGSRAGHAAARAPRGGRPVEGHHDVHRGHAAQQRAHAERVRGRGLGRATVVRGRHRAGALLDRADDGLDRGDRSARVRAPRARRRRGCSRRVRSRSSARAGARARSATSCSATCSRTTSRARCTR